MKNLLPVVLLCSFASGAAPIELEWHPANPTDRPYEIEVDRSRLNAAIPRSETLSVTAINAEGKKTVLKTGVVPGATADRQILHFQVPSGSWKLFLETGKAPAAAIPNLLAKIFPGGKWIGQNLKIVPGDGKLTMQCETDGRAIAVSPKAPIPESWRGKPVRLALTVKSLSGQTFGNVIYLRQYNAQGKMLPECIINPNWSQHMRPAHVETCYQLRGRIRPDAVSMSLQVELDAARAKFDLAGEKLAKPVHPVLELSRLELVPAQELPFPRVNDALFTSGVSGEKDDYALVLDSPVQTVFMHTAGPAAFYSEGCDVRDPAEWFYPTGDGTAELWLKPEKSLWQVPRNNTLSLFGAGHCFDFYKGKYQVLRGDILKLDWVPEKKQGTLLFKDAANKVVKGSFPLQLENGKWVHFACQWSQSHGVELYLNGKRIFHKKFPVSGYDLAKKSVRPGAVMPQNFAVGSSGPQSRKDSYRPRLFRGAVDALRLSDGRRYDGEFIPAKKFVCDARTRVLYNFDRSIDGESGTGSRQVTGILDSQTHFQEHFLRAGDAKIGYTPEKLPDCFNPKKVFKINNYPNLPTVDDFNVAREKKVVKFTLAKGEKTELPLTGKLYMDYVELSAEKRTVHAPLVINEGEADPRSYADLAETLKLANLSGREQANVLFNFVLAATDYFTNHQAMFPVDSNVPFEVPSQPMSLLNGYCGFECGPLNGMLSNLLASAGTVPAGRLNGYAHTFQHGYFDGGNRLYDLSQQKYFPKQSHDGECGLEDLEKITGPFRQCGNVGDHYTKIGLRGGGLTHPSFAKKIGYDLHPGETIRFYFYNRGEYNNFQLRTWQVNNAKLTMLKPEDPDTDDYAVIARDVNDQVNTAGKMKLCTADRVFPHYSAGFLRFSGKPATGNPAFRKDKTGKFIYRVELPYTILGGDFRATAGGKALPLEYSTDGGRHFAPLPANPDGSCRPTGLVRARQSIELRMPGNTESLQAETRFMFNSRVQTGRLHAGKNLLTLRAGNDAPAEVKLQYRQDRAPLKISGGVHFGTIPGNERQLAVILPGETKTFAVPGLAAESKVRTIGPFSAKLDAGKLTVTAQDFKSAVFGAVILDNRGAERELALLGAPDVRLVSAEQIKISGGAKLLAPDQEHVQKSILMTKKNQTLKFPVGTLPAGKYQLWLLLRTKQCPHATTAFFHYLVPGGKPVEIGREINHSCDFLKAKYGNPKSYSRWKWDFPVANRKPTYYCNPTCVEYKAPFHEVEMKMFYGCSSGFEIGALLVLPQPTREFRMEMVKILCGLNCEPWKINP